jgi:hypothetical protein
MLDLSRIRSLNTLDEMTADLTEFITNSHVPVIYMEEYGDAEVFEDDKELAVELLEKIAHRRKSLDGYLKGQATKLGSRRKPKSEPTETPVEPQPAVSSDSHLDT